MVTVLAESFLTTGFAATNFLLGPFLVVSTTFCELEKYFQNKNEVLIGIIDYDFSLSKRKIKNISINPEQKKQIDLDEGDRLITIANFNDLEMVNDIRYLHIL